MNLEKYLVVSDEVKKAIKEGKPVVALESTIISHGMPYPKNVETALNVEKIVRDNGAVPATIAIIKGKITVGISKDEIEYLGKKGLNVPKASRRDLPVIETVKSSPEIDVHPAETDEILGDETVPGAYTASDFSLFHLHIQISFFHDITAFLSLSNFDMILTPQKDNFLKRRKKDYFSAICTAN